MKLAKLAPSAVLLLLAACGAQLPEHDGPNLTELAEGDDALITFPAAAYTGARSLAYGASAARAFAAADGFVAVKFNARAGDVVRFNVSAARATVSYLVFNRRNVAATVDAAVAGGFFYAVPSAGAGEYFIMMRSADRAAASLRVQLATAATPSPPPARAFTNDRPPQWVWDRIVTNAAAGTKPGGLQFASFSFSTFQRQSCTAAGGCISAGTQAITAQKLDISLLYSTTTARLERFCLPVITFAPVGLLLSAQASLDGTLRTSVQHTGFGRQAVELAACRAQATAVNAGVTFANPDLVRDYIWTPQGTGSASSLSLDTALRPPPSTWTGLTIVSETVKTNYVLSYDASAVRANLSARVERSITEWDEYSAEQTLPFSVPNTPAARFPRVAPPAGGFATSVDRRPVDDEAVYASFNRGSDELAAFAPTYLAAGSRGQRACNPLTGCTAWSVIAGAPTASLPNIKLKRAGVDSYDVVAPPTTECASVHIESGRGTCGKFDVTVTRDGVLFDAPYEQTEPVTTSPNVTTETYNNPSFLVSFNQNWSH